MADNYDKRLVRAMWTLDIARARGYWDAWPYLNRRLITPEELAFGRSLSGR